MFHSLFWQCGDIQVFIKDILHKSAGKNYGTYPVVLNYFFCLTFFCNNIY